MLNRKPAREKLVSIGFTPHSADLTHPADRRRFGAAIRYFDLDYEFAQFDQAYDIVLLTTAADLSVWREYKKKETAEGNSPFIIFDFCDNLLASSVIKDIFRRLAYVGTGNSKKIGISYKALIYDIIKSADLVIVGSEEQRHYLESFSEKVCVIHDYFGYEVCSGERKNHSKINTMPRIVWEGLSHGNKKIWDLLEKECRPLSEVFESVGVDIITDEACCKFGKRYFCQPTDSILSKIFQNSPLTFSFHPWSQDTIKSVVAAADVAVIPIPNDPVMRMKPENKLLYFWSLGIPVVASDTGSYKRVMNACGLDGYCVSNGGFSDAILRLLESQAEREEYRARAHLYLKATFGADFFERTWLTVLNRLGSPTSD